MKHYRKLIRLLREGDKTADELYKGIYGSDVKEKGVKQSVASLVTFINDKDDNHPITSYGNGEVYYRIIKECSHCEYRKLNTNLIFITIGMISFFIGALIGFLFTVPIIEVVDNTNIETYDTH